MAQRFPALRHCDADGLFDPSGGVLLADKCLQVLKKLVEERGVLLKDATRLVKVVPGDPLCLETERYGEQVVYQRSSFGTVCWPMVR